MISIQMAPVDIILKSVCQLTFVKISNCSIVKLMKIHSSFCFLFHFDHCVVLPMCLNSFTCHLYEIHIFKGLAVSDILCDGMNLMSNRFRLWIRRFGNNILFVASLIFPCSTLRAWPSMVCHLCIHLLEFRVLIFI